MSAPGAALASPRGAPAGGDGRRRIPGVWWLSPVWITLIVVPAAVLSAATVDDEDFRLRWRSPKTIDGETCLLLLTGGLTLALAAAIVLSSRPPRQRPGRWPDLSPAEVRILRRASTPLFALTMFGYAAYTFTAIRSGIGLSEVLASFGDEGLYSGQIKDTVQPVPGLTTWTQVGIASVVVSSLLLAQQRSRGQVIRLTAVLVVALPRAFLLTERLALLELAVPVVVIAAMRFAGGRRSGRVVRLLPLVFAPLVAAMFAAFEYSRSWVFFRANSNSDFLTFAVQRLAGYYATSLNNGALEMVHNSAPGRWPYLSIAGLWTAPGVENIHLYEKLSGASQDDRYKEILATYGNPEFNNSSGLAAPFVDFGIVGGLVYFAIAGVIIGMLYRGLRESSPIGLLMYPVIFLTVVELPRVLAWSGGRLVLAYAALGVIAWLLRRARRREAATP